MDERTCGHTEGDTDVKFRMIVVEAPLLSQSLAGPRHVPQAYGATSNTSYGMTYPLTDATTEHPDQRKRSPRMSILDSLNGLLGKRPSDEPPAPGYEHFGGEPADPRNSRYWRSIPHDYPCRHSPHVRGASSSLDARSLLPDVTSAKTSRF